MSYIPPADAYSVLDFDRRDTRLTVITNRKSGKEAYRVKSSNKMQTTSIYRSGEDQLVATIQRHDFTPTKITFSGNADQETVTKDIGKWLKTPAFSSCSITFKANGVEYKWKTVKDEDNRKMLFREGHSEPIAWYQGLKRYQIDGRYQWGAAYLALEPEGEKVRDTIVISLIAYQQKVKLWRGIGVYGPVLS